MQVTTKQLVDSQAGKRIKKLASHENSDVAAAAAKVVAAWKQLVKQEQLQSPARAGQAQSAC